MKEQKTIHDLQLHETMIVEETAHGLFACKWKVTRVATGWIYIEENPKKIGADCFSFFVPGVLNVRSNTTNHY